MQDGSRRQDGESGERQLTASAASAPSAGWVRAWAAARAAALAPALAAVLAVAPGAAAASPVAAWRPLGPYGGSVSVLVGDCAGTLYAGTTAAGVFRSDDGTTWTAARAGLPSGAVLDLVADPAAAASATGIATLVAITQGGMARSLDGGVSWSAIVLRGHPTRLAVSAAAHLTVYAFGLPGTSRAAALHRSDDGGATWQPVATDLPAGTVFLAFVADPLTAGVLYGATPRGMVFRSADGGAHWTGVQAADPRIGLTALAIDPSRPAVIYAVPASNAPLLESADSGATWQALPSPINAAFQALAVDPASSATLIGTGSVLPIGDGGPFHGTFKSTDGGQTWTALDTAPALSDGLVLDAPTSVLLSHRQAGRYCIGTANGPGVAASQDGGATWSAVNQGLAATTVQRVTADPFAPGTLYAGLDSGVAKSADRGATWDAADAGLTAVIALGPQPVHDIAADPATTGVLYAGTGDGETSGGAFKSSDGGATWTPLFETGFVVNSIAIDPRRPHWLYAAGSGSCGVSSADDCLPAAIPRAASSRDGGATWREITRIEVPVSTTANTGAFAAVRLSPAASRTVFAAGSRSFESVDAGSSWRRLPLPSPPFSGQVAITDLAIDPSAPARLYAAYAAGQVLKSIDGGARFAPAGALPPGVIPFGFAIDPHGGVYVGTSSGVFHSANAGGTWQRTGEGLDLFAVTSLTLDPRPPATLYATTTGAGAFALDLAAAASAAASTASATSVAATDAASTEASATSAANPAASATSAARATSAASTASVAAAAAPRP